MRILHVTPTFFSEQSVVGGGERYVNNVCAAIHSVPGNDCQCDILSFGIQSAKLSRAPNSELLIHPGNPDDLNSLAGEALDELLGGYEVIHVHQCLTRFGIFMAARARVAGACVIGTDHGGGEIPELGGYPAVANVYDALHAQSEFAKTSFLQFSVASRVIFGPVDESLFPCNLEPRDPGKIVSIGRILAHKGYEHAIAALPGNAELTIIGRKYDNEYFKFLQEVAKGRNVVFRTDLGDEEMVQTMRHAGLLLHTGVHVGYRGAFYAKPELLSLTPLEAMCSGTPTIVSQAGALPELASVVGCRSYRTAEELSSLLRSHMAGELFTATAAEISDSAIQRYGLQQFGRAYMALIQDLIQGR